MSYRLGDDIDDFCPKCKRLTNHNILAIVSDEPAKVRCRSCYHEQPYRHGIAPPSKKDLKKAELFNAVLTGMTGGAAAAEPAAEKPKVAKAK